MSLLAFSLFHGRYFPEEMKKSCKYFHRVSTTSVYFCFYVYNFKFFAYVIVCMLEIMSVVLMKNASVVAVMNEIFVIAVFVNKIFVQLNVNVPEHVSSFSH